MPSMSKIATYAAWIAVAAIAAAARPAAADELQRDRDAAEIASAFGQQREPFNEAYSFADEDEAQPGVAADAPTFPNGTDIEDLDETLPDQGDRFTAADDDAVLLIGTWAWEGAIEGVPASIQTAFYEDGTYESYAVTPVLEMYEVGYWALIDGTLMTEVYDYAPRVIDTPYGPQPLQIEPTYQTWLSFVDEDTVETEIGLSYRID
ncbi:MAG: hypothetical protein R3F55_08575 [Alphaproteobacteria bacterium]